MTKYTQKMMYTEVKTGGINVFMKVHNNKQKHERERDDTMASIAKPNNRAFTLKSEKVSQFLCKNGSSKKTLERFFAHKPKDGVVTPLKGKDV